MAQAAPPRQRPRKRRPPEALPQTHPALFADPLDRPRRWAWSPCVYCHGQGWTTPPEWILAWTHPDYPDMDAVGDALRASGVPVHFQALPVRQRCTGCNGSGRHYTAP